MSSFARELAERTRRGAEKAAAIRQAEAQTRADAEQKANEAEKERGAAYARDHLDEFRQKILAAADKGETETRVYYDHAFGDVSQYHFLKGMVGVVRAALNLQITPGSSFNPGSADMPGLSEFWLTVSWQNAGQKK